MVNYEQTKSLMKSRGVDNLSPLDFSFSLMVAIGINEIQSYMVTIRGKEYEKKTEEQIPKFRERCSLEVTDYLERADIKETIRFLRTEHDRNIKDTALQLEDIDFNAEDLRKILAKFLKEKYKDIDAADAKDLLNAIKIYVDKFGDSGEDGVAKFNRHFIQVYPPYNAVCPNCGKEIDLPRGVNSKCKHCDRQFVWSEEKERYY